MHTHQRGFSLLEILVAFSVLALSLGLLMQIFSGSLRNADFSRDQAQAAALAQSLLAGAGIEEALVQGMRAGQVDGKFRWTLSAAPFVQEPRAGEGGTVTPLPIDLWEVTAHVGWGDEGGRAERAVALSTLRVQPAARTQ